MTVLKEEIDYQNVRFVIFEHHAMFLHECVCSLRYEEVRGLVKPKIIVFISFVPNLFVPYLVQVISWLDELLE